MQRAYKHEERLNRPYTASLFVERAWLTFAHMKIELSSCNLERISWLTGHPRFMIESIMQHTRTYSFTPQSTLEECGNGMMIVALRETFGRHTKTFLWPVFQWCAFRKKRVFLKCTPLKNSPLFNSVLWNSGY